MKVKVLGISASPRRKGNSDLLLSQALAGAESAGAEVEYIRLCDFQIAPCVECNACYKTGRCRVEDDYQSLSAKMLEADRLIFATPIFFMGVCSQGKLLIDRCQCLWAHKYVLKKPLITAGRDRRAMVIAVGGTKSKKMFESIRLTMKYYLDVLEMRYVASLFVNQVDERGQIEKHPSAMKEAFRLGRELALAESAPADKPVDVELT
ncbi:MAG: flavodoxin family protein [Planctomycetota bacterium]|jgi:multimeric flavodoxin WrbA